MTDCDAVYNFVVSKRSPSIQVEGIVCLNLAHGIQGDDVATHPFYGTELCIDWLSKDVVGWQQGMVLGNNLPPKPFSWNQGEFVWMGEDEDEY